MSNDQVFPVSFQHALARESWALFALGVLVIALRIYARIRKMSVRGLEVDDWLVFVALVCYTILIVTLNLTAQGGGSALALPGEDVTKLSQSEIRARVKGAKIDLVAEQAMLNVIWTLKTCMLVFYSRLTMGLRQQLAVKAIAVFVAVGYVACQLTFFFECMPFVQYWQIVPSPPINCMVLYDYAIVQAIFNISSDVFMMLVCLPLILTVSVALKQKLILLIIFSMGIFVIVAAILTKAEFFISVYSDDYMFWYTREASVAVYVANLPCIWPLLREALPVLKSWTPGFVSTGIYHRRGGKHLSTSLPVTRNPTTNRTHTTQHSMDEFLSIVNEHSAYPQAWGFKSQVSSASREIPVFERSKIAGGCETRGMGSSDSDSEELCFASGIRAETTIEMRTMGVDGQELPPQLPPSRGTAEGGFEFDLEKGGHTSWLCDEEEGRGARDGKK